MARLPRLTLAGYPHHVVQRGNNRQAIFSSASDYQVLLDLLQESASRFSVAIHAYVLMANHFHLLVSPDTAEGVPQLMQTVGRRYVRYFNDAQGRSGTLWEGRYRSTVIQPDRYLLPCMAYMDLNPVRAGMVVQADEYPWSSYGHYAGVRVDKLVTAPPLYWALGNTPFAREIAYVDMVRTGISGEQQVALTDSVMGGWALGDANFVDKLQKIVPRRVKKSTPGRPVKTPILSN